VASGRAWRRSSWGSAGRPSGLSYEAMAYQILAEVVLTIHLAFILFVAFGAFLVVWRPKLAWVHLPFAIYGVSIAFFRWTCPLTPLEWRLRDLAGQRGHAGTFLDHYLVSVIYPNAPPAFYLGMATSLLFGTALLYAWAWKRAHRGAAAVPEIVQEPFDIQRSPH
jgi:hypothetical protein